EAVKVSVAQVQRDIAKAEKDDSQPYPPGKVEPPEGKVKGRDGRIRTASIAKPGLSTATVHQCTVEPPDAVDAAGVLIGPHAREAFNDVPLFRELMAAVRRAQKLFGSLANRPGGRFLTDHGISNFRRRNDGAEGRYINRNLEDALQEIRNSMPTHTF